MSTQRPDPQRPVLLALRALKLGDLLVAVPALKGLRRAFPEHELVLAAPGWLAPIVGLVPAVDRLLATPGLDAPVPVAPGTVDVAVNLHGNGPESRGRLEALAPRLRLGHRAPGWQGPEWVDDIHERDRWARLVRWHGASADPLDVALAVPPAPHGAAGAVVVHVGAFYGSRHWPVDRFADVARAARDAGHDVVVTGDASDRERAAAVVAAAGLAPHADLAGKLSLLELAGVIAHARALVSVDTGAAHLASAYGRPSVVIFGPAPPEQWGPPPGPHLVLTDASLRRGDVFSALPDPALMAVTSQDVVSALNALQLSGSGATCV